jgi:hypothetical protein
MAFSACKTGFPGAILQFPILAENPIFANSKKIPKQ